MIQKKNKKETTTNAVRALSFCCALSFSVRMYSYSSFTAPFAHRSSVIYRIHVAI